MCARSLLSSLQGQLADISSCLDVELDTDDVDATCEACGSASSANIEKLKTTIEKAEAELASAEALQYSGESPHLLGPDHI